MPIEFRCSQCQQMLRTPDEAVGQEARCPQCGALTPIPAESIAPEYSEPAPRMPPPPPARRESDNPYVSSPAPAAAYVPSQADNLPSGLATASMVVGIIGLLFSLVCGCLWFISAPLDLIAIVLGIVALQQCNRGESGGRGMALAGIICGSIGLALSLLVLLFFGFASMMGDVKIN